MAAERYCRRCGHRFKPGEVTCHAGEPIGPDRMGSWPCDTFTVAVHLARARRTAPAAGLARLLGWPVARVKAGAVSIATPDAALRSPLLFSHDANSGMVTLTQRGWDALAAPRRPGGD